MVNDDQSDEGSFVESALFQSALLDAAPDAVIVIAESGDIVLANTRAVELFDYSQAEFIGQQLDMLLPMGARTAHRGHVSRFLASPRVRNMGTGLELFGRRRDGTTFPVEISLSPFPTSRGLFVSSAIRDVTQRKQLEAAAKLLADRLAAAVDAVEDPVALFDKDRRLVLCNNSYRAVLGARLEDPVAGRTFEEILDLWISMLAFPDDAARERFRSARIAAAQLVESDAFDAETADGRSFRFRGRRTPDGGFVTTTWDLTGDAEREDELRAARRAAEVASAAKSDFLSSMSHELRTPLNAILGFAQLLQRDKREVLSQRQLERVSQILKGGEHLLHLIDDVLDLSRIEAGGLSIALERLSVSELVSEACATLGPEAGRVGIAVEIAPTEHAPMIHADPTRFAQILMNFGSNAIKYNRPGGSVHFVIGPGEPSFTRVTVVDTGLGIPLDRQDQIFQRFQRAGQETGPIEGMGIGLAISRRLAELMHGTVGFRSQPGEGSAFWIEMPTASPSIVPGAPESSPGPPNRRRHGAMLYIEDDPGDVVLMKDLLGSYEGLELVVSSNATRAPALAKELLPSLIVIDVELGGFETLKRLREAPETRSIPVIALAGPSATHERRRGELAGFYRYLGKPVKIDELEAALEAILKRD